MLRRGILGFFTSALALVAAAVINPDWLREKALWILPVLGVGITLAAFWEHIINLKRNLLQRMGFRKEAVSGQSQIPIHDALDIVIAHFKHEWGEEGILGAHQIPAAHRLREAAAVGKIEIEGRRENKPENPLGGRFSSIWEPINPAFWRDHEFDLTVVLDETAHLQACETHPENPNNIAVSKQPGYAGLRVGKSAVRAKWP